MKQKVITILILMIFVLQYGFTSDEGRKLSNGFKEIVQSEIVFQWKIEGDSLHIILSAPTEGWIAVGFNPSRVMKDADFKLAYVDGSNVYMEDHFGTGLISHKNDRSIGGSDNFEVIDGNEEMGVTTVNFSIPLNSGDEYDTVLVEGDTVKVLLAYSNRDDLSRKHRRRTSIEIIL